MLWFYLTANAYNHSRSCCGAEASLSLIFATHIILGFNGIIRRRRSPYSIECVHFHHPLYRLRGCLDKASLLWFSNWKHKNICITCIIQCLVRDERELCEIKIKIEFNYGWDKVVWHEVGVMEMQLFRGVMVALALG